MSSWNVADVVFNNLDEVNTFLKTPGLTGLALHIKNELNHIKNHSTADFHTEPSVQLEVYNKAMQTAKQSYVRPKEELQQAVTDKQFTFKNVAEAQQFLLMRSLNGLALHIQQQINEVLLPNRRGHPFNTKTIEEKLELYNNAMRTAKQSYIGEAQGASEPLSADLQAQGSQKENEVKRRLEILARPTTDMYKQNINRKILEGIREAGLNSDMPVDTQLDILDRLTVDAVKEYDRTNGVSEQWDKHFTNNEAVRWAKKEGMTDEDIIAELPWWLEGGSVDGIDRALQQWHQDHSDGEARSHTQEEVATARAEGDAVSQSHWQKYLQSEAQKLASEPQGMDVDPEEFKSVIDGPNTATILIDMHGWMSIASEALMDTRPTHTVIGISPGMCTTFTVENFVPEFDELHRIYNDKTIPITEANKRFEAHFRQNDANPKTGKTSELLPTYPGLTEQEITNERVHAGNTPSFMRVYDFDRYYELEADKKSAVHGIYVLNTNNPALQAALDDLNRYMLDPAQSAAVQYKMGSSVSMVDFLRIQRQNLLNVVVARRLFGQNPYDNLTMTDEHSGIPHYTRISMNNILRALAPFGITHVNFIDRSCRVYSSGRTYSTVAGPPQAWVRALSERERDAANALIYGPPKGGKKSKRSKKGKKKTIKLKRVRTRIKKKN